MSFFLYVLEDFIQNNFNRNLDAYISRKKHGYFAFDKAFFSHRNCEETVNFIHKEWNKCHEDFDYLID